MIRGMGVLPMGIGSQRKTTGGTPVPRKRIMGW